MKEHAGPKFGRRSAGDAALPPTQTSRGRSNSGWTRRILTNATHENPKVFVAFWLLVGAVFRVVFLRVAMSRGWADYGIDEVRVAQSLAQGHGYSFDYYGLFRDPLTPGAFFPPAYVYNVFWLLRIFRGEWALAVQNICLSLGASYLIFCVGRRAFNDTVGRIALVGSIFYVPFFLRITHGSPVYFKMFFMCLHVLILCRTWTIPTSRNILLAGMSGGFLALSMPDVLAYEALMAVAFTVRWRHQRPAVPRLALFLLAVLVPILPWTARNWLQFHERCLISTNGGMNFYMGHNPDTTNEADFAPILALDRSSHGEFSSKNEFDRNRMLYREGWRYLQTHPRQEVINLLVRCGQHWWFRRGFVRSLREGHSTPASPPSSYSWIYVICYCILLPFVAFGLWRSRKQWRELAPLHLTMIYSTLVSMLFVVQTKQRLLKVEPFLMVFAAVTVAAIQRYRHREQ